VSASALPQRVLVGDLQVPKGEDAPLEEATKEISAALTSHGYEIVPANEVQAGLKHAKGNTACFDDKGCLKRLAEQVHASLVIGGAVEKEKKGFTLTLSVAEAADPGGAIRTSESMRRLKNLPMNVGLCLQRLFKWSSDTAPPAVAPAALAEQPPPPAAAPPPAVAAAPVAAPVEPGPAAQVLSPTQPTAAPPPAAAPASTGEGTEDAGAPGPPPAASALDDGGQALPPSTQADGGDDAGSAMPGITVEDDPPDPDPTDVKAVQRELVSRKGALRGCYENALKNEVGLKGALTIRFTVALDGSMAEVSFPEDTLGSPVVTRCIHDDAMGWKLAPMKGPVGVSVDLPISFKGG
jgi:hypothetical protein